MYKKNIKYTDFNGNECSEDFYFNLSASELMRMQVSKNGGLAESIVKASKANDMKTMVCLKEDTTDPKWLFHASCLTEIATARIKLNDGKEVKVDIADSSSDEKINKAVQEALDRENLKTAK